MKKETKEIKRFDAVIEAKLLRALNKIFTETNNFSESDILKIESVACVDIAHVIMVEAKTIQAKLVLTRFVDKNNIPKIPKQPIESYQGTVDNWYGSPKARSKYSITYVQDIINVIKIFEKGYNFDDFLTITIGTDTPILIENKHFQFLLAPRIEND